MRKKKSHFKQAYRRRQDIWGFTCESRLVRFYLTNAQFDTVSSLIRTGNYHLAEFHERYRAIHRIEFDRKIYSIDQWHGQWP